MHEATAPLIVTRKVYGLHTYRTGSIQHKPCAILALADPPLAGMAELADAADSKSADPCGHGGSTPPPGTSKTKNLDWIGLSKSERQKSFGGCSGGCWLHSGECAAKQQAKRRARLKLTECVALLASTEIWAGLGGTLVGY
jgi:hypothetical protein